MSSQGVDILPEMVQTEDLCACVCVCVIYLECWYSGMQLITCTVKCDDLVCLNFLPSYLGGKIDQLQAKVKVSQNTVL